MPCCHEARTLSRSHGAISSSQPHRAPEKVTAAVTDDGALPADLQRCRPGAVSSCGDLFLSDRTLRRLPNRSVFLHKRLKSKANRSVFVYYKLKLCNKSNILIFKKALLLAVYNVNKKKKKVEAMTVLLSIVHVNRRKYAGEPSREVPPHQPLVRLSSTKSTADRGKTSRDTLPRQFFSHVNTDLSLLPSSGKIHACHPLDIDVLGPSSKFNRSTRSGLATFVKITF